MAFLEKFFSIVLKPYKLWTNFQKQRQFEKIAKRHMARLNRTLNQFLFLFTQKDDNQEHKDQIVKTFNEICELAELLKKDIPLCSKKMQRKMYKAIIENLSILEAYQIF